MMKIILKFTRLTIVGALFFLFSFIGLFVALVRPFHPNNLRLVARSFAFCARRILGIKVFVESEHFLMSGKSAIYVSNHQNNMDLITFSSVLPYKTVTLGKKSILWIPIFGQMYWLFGNILIDRFNKTRAKSSMEVVTTTIREKNLSIWIMPEGTRNRGRGLLPFKTGAFRTAVDAGVPIVPICFNNYCQMVDLKKWKSGIVRCRVLDPTPTEDLTRDDVPSIVESVRSQMQEAILELDQEVPLGD